MIIQIIFASDIRVSATDNFKLLRIVFIEETDWHAHHAFIVDWNARRPADFNGVVIIVARI